LVLYESGFAPRWYVPREDIKADALTHVQGETFCPYKGLASYYDIGERKRAASSYPQAWAEVAQISDWVSFEPDLADVHLDGRKLVLEAGKPLCRTVSTAAHPGRDQGAAMKDAVRASFDVKVIGPILLARHFAPRMPADGSFVFLPGASARKVMPRCSLFHPVRHRHGRLPRGERHRRLAPRSREFRRLRGPGRLHLCGARTRIAREIVARVELTGLTG
jgi:hypothetical protein